MPENQHIQQAIATTKQVQQATNNQKIAIIDFAKQMEKIINARQLEAMRSSLGF